MKILLIIEVWYAHLIFKIISSLLFRSLCVKEISIKIIIFVCKYNLLATFGLKNALKKFVVNCFFFIDATGMTVTSKARIMITTAAIAANTSTFRYVEPTRDEDTENKKSRYR